MGTLPIALAWGGAESRRGLVWQLSAVALLAVVTLYITRLLHLSRQTSEDVHELEGTAKGPEFVLLVSSTKLASSKAAINPAT